MLTEEYGLLPLISTLEVLIILIGMEDFSLKIKSLKNGFGFTMDIHMPKKEQFFISDLLIENTLWFGTITFRFQDIFKYQQDLINSIIQLTEILKNGTLDMVKEPTEKII